jgi:hypothetical protein
MDFLALLHGSPYDALTRPVPLNEAQQKSKNQSKITEATSILPAPGLARGDRQGWVEAAVLSPRLRRSQVSTSSLPKLGDHLQREDETGPAPEPENRAATYSTQIKGPPRFLFLSKLLILVVFSSAYAFYPARPALHHRSCGIAQS